jgi:hypothetical protein
MSGAINLKPILKIGLAGLDTLCKEGYFWSGKERLTIKEILVKMGYETEPLYPVDDNEAMISKPRQIMQKKSNNP